MHFSIILTRACRDGHRAHLADGETGAEKGRLCPLRTQLAGGAEW